MTAVLDRVGFVGAVIARRLPDGRLELIDGHLRRDVLGSQAIPVVVVSLTDAEADEVLATHDQLASLAVPDTDKLRSLLTDLKGVGVPLIQVGWPEYKLDQVLSTGWAPSTAPTASTAPVTPEQVTAAAAGATDPMEREQKLAPVMCPHCAKEFLVNPDDVKAKADRQT